MKDASEVPEINSLIVRPVHNANARLELDEYETDGKFPDIRPLHIEYRPSTRD